MKLVEILLCIYQAGRSLKSIKQLQDYINTKMLNTKIPVPQRIKIVDSLLENGLGDTIILIETKYGNIIEKELANMSKAQKMEFYKRFHFKWQAISKVVDYLNIGYDERNLQRRFYDNERRYNIQTLTDYEHYNRINSDFSSEDSYNSWERLEMQAIKNGFGEQFTDRHYKSFLNDFMTDITDPVQRQIISLLYEGYSKSEIEIKLNISRQQLKTIISRIKKSLTDNNDDISLPDKQESDISKICSHYDKHKAIDDFGKDNRSKDLHKSICR